MKVTLNSFSSFKLVGVDLERNGNWRFIIHVDHHHWKSIYKSHSGCFTPKSARQNLCMNEYHSIILRYHYKLKFILKKKRISHSALFKWSSNYAGRNCWNRARTLKQNYIIIPALSNGISSFFRVKNWNHIRKCYEAITNWNGNGLRSQMSERNDIIGSKYKLKHVLCTRQYFMQ